ncbi:cytochrome c oxidase assembly protein [Sphingomonas morindae]|uniref:Cytochrome c oxidase assembly protein n=1 Tax=Sphingomonas morindae TaxID=1541170 RepID=A0ABY4X624_9SPHN|nr:cytochrome c oxidase assembly protein [Sphingomonas morindae]USI72340.1 cytochrome c oxidase assembly protein [Sphingomonas morindae]
MRALSRRLAFLSALLAAAPAAAHPGHHHGAPGWTWDPAILVPLALALALFLIGWRRIAARSGRGAAWRRRLGLFVAGWLMLAGALVSPLHEAGERSFALHMTEHELLMLVAAPLLVLAEPLAVLLWAFPAGARRGIGRLVARPWLAAMWRWLTAPVPATALQAAALWGWHAPALFDRALRSPGWHAAQHASFLATALLFWTAMLGRRGGRAAHAAGQAVAALCLFATSVVSGGLGALMAVSDSPWYAGYAALGLAPFGLTPAEDQQLAGLIMWVPGGLVHALAALVLVRQLLIQGEARHADAL